MPRPSKFKEVADQIVEKVRAGAHQDVAARAHGIDPSTLRHWRMKGRRGESPFAEWNAEMDAAEAGHEVDLVGHLQSAIEGGDPKIALDAVKFNLERRYAERWSKAVRDAAKSELAQFLDRIEPLCLHADCPHWLWAEVLEAAAYVGSARGSEAEEAPGAASREEH
jgi:hypothetical protein